MNITGTIEKNGNNYYQISSEDEFCNCCFGGYGYSVEEAKADFMRSIEEAKEIAVERGEALPKDAGEISVVFKYDLGSFFDSFPFLNVTEIAKLAGISPSLMRQYTSGMKNAGEKTYARLSSCMSRVTKELQAAAFL